MNGATNKSATANGFIAERFSKQSGCFFRHEDEAESIQVRRKRNENMEDVKRHAKEGQNVKRKRWETKLN